MASTASLARPALTNLVVNTFGTPTKTTPLAKEPTSRKRRIDEVEEAENADPACKVILSPMSFGDKELVVKADVRSWPLHAHSTFSLINTQKGSLSCVVGTLGRQSSTRNLTKAFVEKAIPTSVTMPEEAPSPHSTVSSQNDYDPDDTIESQQTAATEVTQPLTDGQMTVAAAAPSQARQVRVLYPLLC